MAFETNLFVRGASANPLFLARDPRFLIGAFVLIAAVSFMVPTSVGLLLLLAYVLALYGLAKLPVRALGGTLKTLAFFAVLIIGVNAYFVQGEAIPGTFGYLSWEGVRSGAYYTLRVAVLLLSVLVFLAAASQETIARGVSALLTPVAPNAARRIAMYGFLSFGFLPLFADEIERIRVAQRFRGGSIEGGLWAKLRGVRLLLVPLLVSAIHRSGQLAMAVEIRNIRSSIDELLEVPAPTFRDYTFAGVTVVVLTFSFLVG